MSLLRFLHLADVHLGYEQYGLNARYNDFYQSFRRAIDDALREQVDFVIIAGDLFHQRSISPQTLLQAAHELDRLQKVGIPAVAVMGNHERSTATERTTWLDYLAGRGLLTLLAPSFREGAFSFPPYRNGRGGWVEIGPARLYGIPFYGAGMPEVVAEAAAWLGQEQAGERPACTILIAHAGVEGTLPGFVANLSMEQIAPLRPHIDYLALGHIHKPALIEGWLYNPGSLEPNNVAEAEYGGGGLLVELESSAPARFGVQQRRYCERPFVRLRLEVTDCGSPAALRAAAEKLLRAQRLPAELPAVVELTLQGTLHFNHAELDLHALENLMSETLQPAPLHRLLRDATSHPGAARNAVGDGAFNRAELERQVLHDLLRQDERYRPQAAAWAGLLRELKELALENTDAALLVERARAGQRTIREGGADDAPDAA